MRGVPREIRAGGIDLDGEFKSTEMADAGLDSGDAGFPYLFEDDGGNVCGCSGASVTCQVKTSGLTPPIATPIGG